MKERLGIVGTGAIAAGLGRGAAGRGEGVVGGRSPGWSARGGEEGGGGREVPVYLAARHNREPATADDCMRLGAGHPMGPLALLDFVGLDVAAAIGEELGVEVPARVRELIAAGTLGRKTGRGFYTYGT